MAFESRLTWRSSAISRRSSMLAEVAQDVLHGGLDLVTVAVAQALHGLAEEPEVLGGHAGWTSRSSVSRVWTRNLMTSSL